MARPLEITPRRDPNGRSFIASFTDASGKRVTRGLGTHNKAQAKLICAGIVRLRSLNVTRPEDVPNDVGLDAIRLYFGAKRKGGILHGGPDTPKPDYVSAMSEALRFPKPHREAALRIILERDTYKRKADASAVEIATLKRDLAAERNELATLKQTAIARQVQIAARVPAMEAALAEYKRHLDTNTSGRANRLELFAEAKRFAVSLPVGTKTPADVTSDHIAGYLDAAVAAAPRKKPQTYRRGKHIKLAAFLNWSAERWGFPSPIKAVQFPKRSRLDSESGDIVWHSLKEVEGVLKALPARLREASETGRHALSGVELDRAAVYWQALVATLAYGGLRLAELCWLRTSDLDLKRKTIRVEPVEVAGARHNLKTGHSVRTVNLDPKLLAPRLAAYMKAGLAGEFHLFGMPGYMQRRARAHEGGHPERWAPHTLGVVLRGHGGGKLEGKGQRNARPGLLPAGMHALTLRHTAASLLLRSGATMAEVAAHLGNTVEVCEKHYARVTGSEVKVNLAGRKR